MKKILLVGVILAISSHSALAASPYVGANLGVGGYKSQPGVMANIFGGYGTTLERIYLGGELNANVANYSQYNFAYGLGVSFIPGVMLSEHTMIYGRLGLDSVHVPKDSGTYILATQYGLGLQTNVSKNWDVRGEYAYSYARSAGQFNVGVAYKFD